MIREYCGTKPDESSGNGNEKKGRNLGDLSIKKWEEKQM